MCGGCGRTEIGDWLTPAVRSIGTRELASRVINQLSGGSVRVAAISAGFVVRYLTGRTVVAPTLSAVWAEVLRQGRVRFDEPPRPSIPVGSSKKPVAPELPAGHLAVAVADPSASCRRLATVWPASEVLMFGPSTGLDDIVTAASTRRLLVCVRPDDVAILLSLVTQPAVRLRTTVTALVHDGQGPAWATDVTGLGDAQLRATLDGWSAAAEVYHNMSLSEAAAWVEGLRKSGTTRGRRVTLNVDAGQWVIDVADGHGLAVRPHVPAWRPNDRHL
jgi:hypothetical protein